MTTVALHTRDQVLRGALAEIRNELGKSGKDAPRRARDLAVKTLFATRDPDPLPQAATALLQSLCDLHRELQVATAIARRGETWSCIHVPDLLKKAELVVEMARAAGVRP